MKICLYQIIIIQDLFHNYYISCIFLRELFGLNLSQKKTGTAYFSHLGSPSRTPAMSLNPAQDEVYSMQHYVIMFLSDLPQVGGFLWP
jgi:hypothetical protein